MKNGKYPATSSICTCHTGKDYTPSRSDDYIVLLYKILDMDGYPRDLKGEPILLDVRKFQVVETWDLSRLA